MKFVLLSMAAMAVVPPSFAPSALFWSAIVVTLALFARLVQPVFRELALAEETFGAHVPNFAAMMVARG